MLFFPICLYFVTSTLEAAYTIVLEIPDYTFTDPVWYKKSQPTDYIHLSHEPSQRGRGEVFQDAVTLTLVGLVSALFVLNCLILLNER